MWRYWTDPQRMCDWWGAAAELDPRPGGACRVEMGGGPVMVGEYVELVPHERIVFTFGWEPTDGVPDVAPGSTRVEVTLTADDGDTILTLRHTGLPAAFADEHTRRLGPLPPAPGRRQPKGRRRERRRAHRDRHRPPVAEVAAVSRPTPTTHAEWYANIESVEWKTEPPLAGRFGSSDSWPASSAVASPTTTRSSSSSRRAARHAHRRGPFPMETTYTWAPPSTAAPT